MCLCLFVCVLLSVNKYSSMMFKMRDRTIPLDYKLFLQGQIQEQIDDRFAILNPAIAESNFCDVISVFGNKISPLTLAGLAFSSIRVD